MIERTETFSPLESTADRLGVPAAWLRQEAQAGRVPCLRAGRRLLFNVTLVEHALLERAVHGQSVEAASA
jgi:hypothetical protein